jgi:hypothetical protein
MNKHSNSFRNRLLLSALLLCGGTAQAALIASSAVVYEDGSGNGRIVEFGQTINNSSTISYTTTTGLAASGYGLATYGALHASAFSTATTTGSTTETRGQGTADWIDLITFNSATQTGQAYARASFSLSGGLSSSSGASTGGNSTIAATVRANGQSVYTTTGQLVSQNGAITVNDTRQGVALNGILEINPATSLTGVFSFDIPFVFGTEFQLAASLAAFTQSIASSSNTASAYSNFGSTGYWGGISQVHLADGTVLTDYSLSSQSGFDWTNAATPAAVPAPAAAWLFVTGLASLIGVAKRKSRT